MTPTPLLYCEATAAALAALAAETAAAAVAGVYPLLLDPRFKSFIGGGA